MQTVRLTAATERQVTVLRAICVAGQPVQPGTVLTLASTTAAELVTANKVAYSAPAEPSPRAAKAPKAKPAEAPAPEPTE